MTLVTLTTINYQKTGKGKIERKAKNSHTHYMHAVSFYLFDVCNERDLVVIPFVLERV